MIYGLLFLIILGVAYTIYKLTGIDPRAYHVEPFKGLVDEKLFGGTEALRNLPLAVPLLYLQRKREEVDGERYLNVLIPLPPAYAVTKTIEEWEPTTRLLSITYFAGDDDSGDTAKRLFHETLIPIGAEVSTIAVRCAAGPDSGGSGIGTGDSDTADPIKGGPATPYMSGNLAGSCTLVYNGGDSTMEATVTNLAGTTVATTLNADGPIQRISQPAGVVASVAVGGRVVRDVYAL